MSQSTTKPPYYVELLTRDKSLKTRHRFASLPIRVGRSYDNELIIDDPYIAANHAVIEMTVEGSLQIRDLSSENGIIADGKKQENFLLEDHIVRLGHTNLRVRHAGFEVEKTLLDKAAHQWEGWPPALVGLALITLTALGETWLSSFESFSTITAISAVSLLLFLVLLWCGGWAFATRMINGASSRFGRHVFIAGCAIVLLDLLHLLSVTFAYAFSLPFLTRYSSVTVSIVFAGMIFFHLATIYRHQSKRILYSSLVIGVLGISLTFMTNYQRSGTLADSLYMTYILPSSFHLSGDMPADDFIAEAETLKPALEEARKQPANNKRGLLGN